MMEKGAKIYVAGHQGLVGSALMRALRGRGFTNLVIRSPQELDLRTQHAVHTFFETHKPAYVFLAAAKVGGIQANVDYPADFIYDNLAIQLNVIDAAYRVGVKKFLFFGSSCIYPRNCQQPIKEEYLLTDQLEQTNEPYAIAKIAGIKLCQAYNKQYGTNFIACMPTNLYGPGDNFDLQTSHVIPGLIAKMHKARIENKDEVLLWGTGKPLREFLFVDDLADAALHLMEHYSGNEVINVGSGAEYTIAHLAREIKESVGFQGSIIFDATKPDGTPRKLLDSSRLSALGWQVKTPLNVGLRHTIKWFKEQNV